MLKVTLIIVVVVSQLFARIFFVGSNPFMSSIAFPQDILQFPGDAVYMWPSYQQLPWWGDLDQPTKKPNDTYTTTEEGISYSDGRYFEQDATIHQIRNKKGLSYHLNDKLMSYTIFESSVVSMVNVANGQLRADSQNELPFKYKINHVLGKFYVQPTFAFKMHDIPIGLKGGIGFTNTVRLKSNFDYTLNGVNYNSEAFAWGWSRVHCSSIFDMDNVAGDAFVQNEYARGPVWQFDIQGGTTLPKVKLGARYRTVLSSQDQFSYSNSGGTGAPGSKLVGSWEESQWEKKSIEHTARIYGNYNWFQNKRVKYNTLFFLGYVGSRSRNALSSNPDVESSWRDLANNIFVEVNPNMNLNFGMPMFFLDAALLIEYSYTRFSNRYNRWVNGGNVDSYRETSTSEGPEYENASFSYANDNFFDIGFDMNVSLPIYRDNKRAASLGLILFVNNKFTKFTKYYGRYTDNSDDFNANTLRSTRKRETWFNSAWVVNVRQAPWTFQIDISQPLLYKLSWKTEVSEKQSDKILWTQMKEMPYAAQQGITAGFFIGHDIKSLSKN